MQWSEIRRTYPRQWLLVEALSAHSVAGKRVVEDLAVVGLYQDGRAAMTGYKELRRWEPGRELYVVHTDRETLDIRELHWFGIRAAEDLPAITLENLIGCAGYAGPSRSLKEMEAGIVRGARERR
jgi:hypothetical protein